MGWGKVPERWARGRARAGQASFTCYFYRHLLFYLPCNHPSFFRYSTPGCLWGSAPSISQSAEANGTHTHHQLQGLICNVDHPHPGHSFRGGHMAQLSPGEANPGIFNRWLGKKALTVRQLYLNKTGNFFQKNKNFKFKKKRKKNTVFHLWLLGWKIENPKLASTWEEPAWEGSQYGEKESQEEDGNVVLVTSFCKPKKKKSPFASIDLIVVF